MTATYRKPTPSQKLNYPDSANLVLGSPLPDFAHCPMQGLPILPQVVEGRFDDVDAMAASPLAWDQKYEQISPGRFSGHLKQLVLGGLQLGSEYRSTGILQRGSAPPGTWVFGLPLMVEGSLHVRRRPAPPGQLLTATSRDDVGLTATGPTKMMVVVLPMHTIDYWMQVRRGLDRLDVDLPSPRWQVPPGSITQRAASLSALLQDLTNRSENPWSDFSTFHVEAQIAEIILGLIPSAEIVEPLHNRARIARAVLNLLIERVDDPPSITELCSLVGARERTLHLSCVEAFGRPPGKLLAELRLNAAHRALRHPHKDTQVTTVASRFGFSHFGRFAANYRMQFGESPSATLTSSIGESRRRYPRGGGHQYDARK